MGGASEWEEHYSCDRTVYLWVVAETEPQCSCEMKIDRGCFLVETTV